MSLRIVADENIPCAQEAFSCLGNVRLMPGRAIDPDAVSDADALIVRSITKVNRSLLEGSPVKFVGTATIGFDHIDLNYLNERGIEFASAPGSNANSVSEYITASLLLLSEKLGKPLAGSKIAIVGVGNVGTRVHAKAQALGMECLLNDPPRYRETIDPKYLLLGEAISDADFVTLHVPLQEQGPDMTLSMADSGFFAFMKSESVFLNTSRGPVTDERELAFALERGHLSAAVLDVWRNEPSIDPNLVGRAFLATPHIAGYSFDGKVNGTRMMFESLARWTRTDVKLDFNQLLPEPEVGYLDLSKEKGNDEAILRKAVLSVYNIKGDDQRLRQAAAGPEIGQGFDRLRKDYPRRREFQNTKLALPDRKELREKAKGIGFNVHS